MVMRVVDGYRHSHFAKKRETKTELRAVEYKIWLLMNGCCQGLDSSLSRE